MGHFKADFMGQSIEQTCGAFAASGFRQEALERVPQAAATSLAEFLARVDTLRQADTTMRNLTDDEFLRGKERLRQAARRAEEAARAEPRTSGKCRSSGRPRGTSARVRSRLICRGMPDG